MKKVKSLEGARFDEQDQQLSRSALSGSFMAALPIAHCIALHFHDSP